MVIQEKVQNRSLKMTRENLIFAKTIGTLYTIGADRNVISQMVEETKNTETDILGPALTAPECRSSCRW